MEPYTVKNSSILNDSRQALVVTTIGWSDKFAVCQRFERESFSKIWKREGSSVPAVTGRNGLGWGIGLHGRNAPPGTPLKKEGDGKAPAGVFFLISVFGHGDHRWRASLRIRYHESTNFLVCVDDPDSAFYNRIIDMSITPVCWKSHEEMIRADGQYRLGIVVGHNTSPPMQGCGSCIFLHVWTGPEHGTSGCTAFSYGDLEEIVQWLDETKKPVLVQLPHTEYERLGASWGLP